MKVDKEKFYGEVYDIVKEIPCGQITTYGQIAHLIGRPEYSRMVGNALKVVPRELNLPCHRVVNSKGRLVPFWQEQRNLLLKEKITFKKNGCADIEKHMWQL